MSGGLIVPRRFSIVAEVGLRGGTVATDVGVGGEFDDTVSKGDAAGLGAEEDYTVGF